MSLPSSSATADLESAVKGYEDGVLTGTIPAGKLIKQAIQRHRKDLEHGHERGLTFDKLAAAKAVRFFSFLSHSKGTKWAGKRFELSPWQTWIVWSIFGWKRSDGTRRYRIAYVEIPRKNGKSTLLAGIALYLLIADGEPGAEVYSAATSRDQAKIVWEEAKNMVLASPPLRERVTVVRNNLSVLSTHSKFEPLSADARQHHGRNIHGAVVDELHIHPDRELWDTLKTGTGSRTQSICFAITTAGYDVVTICGEMNDHTQKVCGGIIEDDSFFGFVSTIDEGDDPWDETVWAKANPNYGISVNPSELRDEAVMAKAMPSARNAFLRLHLNVWTNQDVAAIPVERWDACDGKFDIETMAGWSCYVGLDLSKTGDLTAAVPVFPPQNGSADYRVVPYFWIPEDRAIEKTREDRVPYVEWSKMGLVETTPGNVTDYEFIRARLNEIRDRFNVVEILFDPWNATDLATRLQADGFNVVAFHQSFANFTMPTKRLMELVDGRLLAHNGHPVLRWNVSNLSVKEDANQNMRPVKPERKTAKRIDGAVAMIMGIGGAIRTAPTTLDVVLI